MTSSVSQDRSQKLLVVSDNQDALGSFMAAWNEVAPKGWTLVVKSSPSRTEAAQAEADQSCVDVRRDVAAIVAEYDLVLSVHCRQIFPDELVRRVRCLNIHPGYLPFNRGMFPQVFSILNHTIFGITLHQMDARIDCGKILARTELPIQAWDTSRTLYDRAIEAERELFLEVLPQLLDGTLPEVAADAAATLYRRSDYERLRELDLQQPCTLGEALDLLRALSHPPYRNAWFRDPETDQRVFVSLSLDVEAKVD